MKNLKQQWQGKTIILLLLVFLNTGCSKDDEPQNQQPIANAGSNIQAEIGSVVKVDASGSSDPDGNTLSYKWSFVNKPISSAAAIVGVGSTQAEFTLDKAGTYELQLIADDGISNTQDTIIITNKAPVINSIGARTSPNISDDDDSIAQRGELIYIDGLYFSPDESENTFSLGGVDCEFLYFHNSSGDAVIRVADDAIAGDLVVTVGAHRVTWSVPFKLMDPPVINAFIESDNTLEQSDRYYPDSYKEIGTVFTPLKNGTIVAFGARANFDEYTRVTLWDVATKSPLTSLEVHPYWITSYKALETPIAVKAGQQYMISMFNNNWYNYMHSSQDDIYPIVVNENIRLENMAATGAYDKLNDDYDFPDEDMQTFYVPLGAEFVFVPDIE